MLTFDRYRSNPADQIPCKLDDKIDHKDHDKDERRIADAPVRSHEVAETLKRRSLYRPVDEEIVAVLLVVKERNRRRDDRKVEERIPEMFDRRVNSSGDQKEHRIAGNEGVPEKAVEAHEVKERVGCPVGADQRCHRPRHEKDKRDLPEGGAEGTEAVAARFLLF